MNDPTNMATAAERWRGTLSRAALGLGWVVLAGTFFLMSPPSDAGYPGALPWGELSVLRQVTQLLSLFHSVPTPRGVEIKDLVLHLGAAAALLVMALRAVFTADWRKPQPTIRGAWFYAQLFLAAWVAVSLLSAWWSGDPLIALGQGAVYGFGLAWAVGLAWTLERRELPRLLAGYVIIAAGGAALCLWYFYARNPFHRPGFPIGNPGPLAVCMLVAGLLAVSMAAGAVREYRRERRRADLRVAVLCLAALVPLGWCFALAHSRSAAVAAVIGLAAVFFLRLGKRGRIGVVLTMLVLGGGLIAWAYVERLDLTMGRGATVRFRVYAWRYAAELWMRRPISGVGAGGYARYAGNIAAADRALDPAAFVGDDIGHAHNELFEVFSEIGLAGGLTYVAGIVATLAAAAGLLRDRLDGRYRWLLTGLTAAAVAILADAMLGVSMRLPGVPALFFLLLGTLWAACRCAARQEGLRETIDAVAGRPTAVYARYAVAGGAVLGAIVGGWLGWENWRGVRAEYDLYRAFGSGRYAEAVRAAAFAEGRLLEPSRQLFAEEYAVRSRYGMAERAFSEYAARSSGERTAPGGGEGNPASAPASSAAGPWETANELAVEVYVQAHGLFLRAPTLSELPGIEARAAEMLADLHWNTNEARSQQWRQAAWEAWLRQRREDPYDVETLLALLRYYHDPDERVALLRDALRNGFPPGEWQSALRAFSGTPGFDAAIQRHVQAAGPIDPQTDLDSLIASMAPEVFRLAAAWHALRGEFDEARALAARASLLYQPMQPRFPTLLSCALAEQAEYAFRADPLQPAQAEELAAAAVDALPRVQPQVLEEMARPFRARMARYLLAAGREEVAREVVVRALTPDQSVSAALAELYVGLARTFVRREVIEGQVAEWLTAALRHDPANLEAWSWRAWLLARSGDVAAVNVLLGEAATAGVTAESIDRIRHSLCLEFPELCEKLQGGATEGD